MPSSLAEHRKAKRVLDYCIPVMNPMTYSWESIILMPLKQNKTRKMRKLRCAPRLNFPRALLSPKPVLLCAPEAGIETAALPSDGVSGDGVSALVPDKISGRFEEKVLIQGGSCKSQYETWSSTKISSRDRRLRNSNIWRASVRK
jgi:hypothetical protein